MKVTVKVDVDTAAIMRRRGLGGDNRAQVYLASEVKRLSDPYVPMQQGLLKNMAVVASDGSTLTYTQPYAHYQYYGEAMAGRAPKQYTGKPLTYHGAPMRGKQWDKRMMADKSDDLTKNLKTYIGRLSK
ncbi:MAG: capsid protein [Clostridia bacterium]|nr:capsid protein [Clostridia bacterium]